MFVENEQTSQKITPCMLFSNEVCGRTEEALNYYTEIFENSNVKFISRYGKGEAANQKAKINYDIFKISGYNFAAMDNGYDADFNFNEVFSIIINCEDQKEIDYLWDKLSAVPEAEQCGWVKDKFGVSWQIILSNMNEFLNSGDKEKIKKKRGILCFAIIMFIQILAMTLNISWKM